MSDLSQGAFNGGYINPEIGNVQAELPDLTQPQNLQEKLVKDQLQQELVTEPQEKKTIPEQEINDKVKKNKLKFLFFNFNNKGEMVVFTAFMIPPIIISIISMIHIVTFFELTNSSALAWTLSAAFEFASISALFALSALKKINRITIWTLFLSIVVMQIVGNVYHSYININMTDPNLLKLLNILGVDVLNLNWAIRIIGFLQGGILPIISLSFVKATVSYLTTDSD